MTYPFESAGSVLFVHYYPLNITHFTHYLVLFNGLVEDQFMKICLERVMNFERQMRHERA
ncbi:hypothetical protein R8510_05231 [Ralstonia chuxiongensis]|nr:hypothetical protein R8510_05231 [Ralstonia chuxiongensis]